MKVDDAMLQAAVRQILLAVGEDPTREGLLDTPARVSRAYAEMLAGYSMDPAKILERTFPRDGYDEMVVQRAVYFTSLCEHHMLPFHGVAAVGYLPRKDVVGISKLARLVDCFARRLQIQERMTVQIGNAIRDHLKPLGYGVRVCATHLCMCARGVNKPGSEMVTNVLGGSFREGQVRDEFFRSAGA